MTERPNSPESYFLRTDYSLDDDKAATLKLASIEVIEEWIEAEKSGTKSSANDASISYSYVDGETTTLLSFEQPHEIEIEDEIFASGKRIDRRTFRRRPMTTEAFMSTHHYAKGALATTAMLSVHDTVSGSDDAFVTSFVFDHYRDGTLTAMIERTDVMDGLSQDWAEMTLYDFREFESQVKLIVALRKQLVSADNLNQTNA